MSAGSARSGTAAGAQQARSEPLVPAIIAEFTAAFAAARGRWAGLARELHPDLGGDSLFLLQLIWRKGPLTATELCATLDMDKAFLSRQVAKLRELGLVSADPSPEDRRSKLLTVSERAQALFAEIRQRWSREYQEHFADWSDDDLERFYGALVRFNSPAGEA